MGRDAVAMRLSQFAERPRSLEEMELEQPFSERVLRPLIQRLAAFGERFSRKKNQTPQQRQSAVDKTRRRLLLAGSPNRWTASDWLGVKIFGALIGAGIGALLIAMLGGGPVDPRADHRRGDRLCDARAVAVPEDLRTEEEDSESAPRCARSTRD